MGWMASRNTLLLRFLVLFPVTVQLPSRDCVTYKQTETCGVKGSSVRFPCSYPNQSEIISKFGWCRSLDKKPKPIRDIPAYASRVKYTKPGRNDCTMTLRDLRNDDASVYYFKYRFRNAAGHSEICHGTTGVLLHVLDSPVSIMVDGLVRTVHVSIADLRVVEGQRIKLTCVPTCAANLTSNLGYIWYKDQLQLNGSGTYSPMLALDPVSNKDAGSYVCAMSGYKNLPSSAVNLIVGKNSQSTERPHDSHEPGARKNVESTQNPDESQNSASIFTVFSIFAVSVCGGFSVVTLVVLILLKLSKRNKRTGQCDETAPGPPNPNSDCYMSLDLSAASSEYDILNNVGHSPSHDNIYENLYLPTTHAMT